MVICPNTIFYDFLESWQDIDGSVAGWDIWFGFWLLDGDNFGLLEDIWESIVKNGLIDNVFKGWL